MATMRRETWIDRPADDVWALVGDAGAVTEWFPQMSAVKVEGNQRTIRLASGIELVEEFVAHHDMRRFQYRLLGPFPIVHHLASIDVLADGQVRCLVVYSTDVEPNALVLVLDAAVVDALANLKLLMEDAR